MRRLLILAAFLLAISSIPVCAQRGARGSSGGSHGGFSGRSGFVGHASGGPAFGGSHVSSQFGSHFGSQSGSHFGSGSRSLNRGDHFRGSRFGARGFRNRCIGCWGYGYPFYANGGIDPYWWWDSYSSYDEDAARERELASQMNSENLDEQQRICEQEQDAYARPMSRAHESPASDDRSQADPPTVLVFRDQHQREIQNYAIVGQMLWNFTAQRTEKIPLSALDIPATTKANDDRGVDFRVPHSSEGQ